MSHYLGHSRPVRLPAPQRTYTTPNRSTIRNVCANCPMCSRHLIQATFRWSCIAPSKAIPCIKSFGGLMKPDVLRKASGGDDLREVRLVLEVLVLRRPVSRMTPESRRLMPSAVHLERVEVDPGKGRSKRRANAGGNAKSVVSGRGHSSRSWRPKYPVSFRTRTRVLMIAATCPTARIRTWPSRKDRTSLP